MQKEEQKIKKVTFRGKENNICLICGTNHQREVMFQGGGRLIAGRLTTELRRLYEKNARYGRVNPNDYSIMVCPRCLYACFPDDWTSLDDDEISIIRDTSDLRRQNIEKILGPLDFQEERNLVTGAATYLLALDCYIHRRYQVSPTPKKAVCSIRAAWYFDDLNASFPGRYFDIIREFCYERALEFYDQTLEVMQNGREPVDSSVNILGPDSDKNWRYDGVIYMASFLKMKYRDKIANELKDQLNMLFISRRSLSRLYGSGKVSKNKPSDLIVLARDLYDKHSELIKKLGDE